MDKEFRLHNLLTLRIGARVRVLPNITADRLQVRPRLWEQYIWLCSQVLDHANDASVWADQINDWPEISIGQSLIMTDLAKFVMSTTKQIIFSDFHLEVI